MASVQAGDHLVVLGLLGAQMGRGRGSCRGGGGRRWGGGGGDWEGGEEGQEEEKAESEEFWRLGEGMIKKTTRLNSEDLSSGMKIQIPQIKT